MKMNRLFSIISILILLLFASCGKQPLEEPPELQEVEREDVSVIIFTSEEETYIYGLKEKGFISVVSVLKPGNLEIDAEGHYSGFQYDLAVEFAKFLDLELKMESVLFADLFARDGVVPDKLKTDPSYTYDPDIFQDADVCAGFNTILPWRLQIMDMIAYLPVREMIVSRREDSIKQIPDLEGKTVGYAKSTSYEDILIDLREQQEIVFSMQSFPFEKDLMYAVNEGEIDATVVDSQKLFLTLRNYPDLVAELPITDFKYVSWGIKKGNNVLEGIIRKFFKYIRNNGLFDRIFQKQYSIELDNYLTLTGFNNLELYQLDLTPAEMAWLNEKWKTGKLTMATVEQEETYIVRDDGSITGFDYELLTKIAQTLGLTLEVSVQDSISNFFKRNGVFNQDVVSDPSISYTPDLLKKVDVYAAAFAILPWREKLMTFIPELPAGLILAGRKGEEIDDITGLDGKRIAVAPGAFQETMITQMMKEKGFTVEFVYLASNDDPFEFVSSGKADYQLDGSVYLARGMKNIEGLSASPINFGRFTIGLAVKKDDTELASILEKYVSLSLADGSFGKLWTANNGVDFDYYLKLVAE
jgi:ABC-type amino acid transport substrate-binding protein